MSKLIQEALWEYQTENELPEVCLSHDGSLISILSPREIALLDREGNLLWRHEENDLYLYGIAISPRGNYLVATGEADVEEEPGWGGRICFFDISQRVPHEKWISRRAIGVEYRSPLVTDDGHTALGSRKVDGPGAIQLLAETGQLMWQHDLGKGVGAVSMTPRSTFIAAGAWVDPPSSGLIYLFDANGEKVMSQLVPEWTICSMAVANDGEYITVAAIGVEEQSRAYSNSEDLYSKPHQQTFYLFDKAGNRLWRYSAGPLLPMLPLAGARSWPIQRGKWPRILMSQDGKAAVGITSQGVYYFGTEGLRWRYESKGLLDATLVMPAGEYALMADSQEKAGVDEPQGLGDASLFDFLLLDQRGDIIWRWSLSVPRYEGWPSLWGLSFSADGRYVAAVTKSDKGCTVSFLPGMEALPRPSRAQSTPAQAAPVPALAHVPQMARAKLVVKRTGRVGQEFPIDQESMNIGRWDADRGIFPEISLSEDDPGGYISRRHARIFVKEGEYFIEDLGSTNGTFVNKGPRLTPGSPQKLQNGDEIIMGRTFFTFVVG